MYINKLIFVCAFTLYSTIATAEEMPVLKAGHPSLKEWKLPAVPVPTDNLQNAARVDLGRHLFFDTRLSGDGNMSCATCHNPALGWSDALPTGRGAKGLALDRASPTVINSAYNKILMWDGRKKNLEDQAMGPMESNREMNMDTVKLFKWLNESKGYKKMFDAAYPNEEINAITLAKAMAAFERTIVMNNSPFDKWVAGDAKAMSKQEVHGFSLFLDPAKGNCVSCHSAPSFTDNGFHNIGLASWGNANPDMGRYAQKPVAKFKGAFKTPQLHGIALTAPYFHDGSAKTLMDVVTHYEKGGVVKTNLDPNMKSLTLSKEEKDDLVAFLNALTGTIPAVAVPDLLQ
jgi:cytochrome c peroxidase